VVLVLGGKGCPRSEPVEDVLQVVEIVSPATCFQIFQRMAQV